MNVKELIEKYELELKDVQLKFGANFKTKVYEELLDDLKQLDEPEKVKVPQFVAEYIEQMKNEDYHLIGAMTEIRSHKNKKIDDWFWDYDDNMEIFARAWLDGYEVEKEPKYTVKIKATKHYFAKDGNGRIYFSLKYESAFTKIELEKANLGWVFDCEGIEVEEVE